MSNIMVVTPTIPMRHRMVQECMESVAAQTRPVDHTVTVDTEGVGPAVMRNNMVHELNDDVDWICFLDDDDLLYPDYFETVEPHLADYDVVYTWGDGLADTLQVPFNGEMLDYANSVPMTALVPRQLFLDVGGFKCDVLYEDWALWLDIYNLGGRFKCIPEVHWTYRDHPYARQTYKNNRIRQSGLVRSK